MAGWRDIAGTVRNIAAIALCFVVWRAFAEPFVPSGGPVPDLSQYAKTADLTAMQTSIMADMPQPAITNPLTDSTTSAIGSATTRYMLADSVRPARYRSASGTISGSGGVATLTWSTPFTSTPNPIGDPSVINTNSGGLSGPMQLDIDLHDWRDNQVRSATRQSFDHSWCAQPIAGRSKRPRSLWNSGAALMKTRY